MHKLKIESMGVPYAKVLVDGKPMKATKVDVHMAADCVPDADITLLCEPDLEIDTLVTFDYSPRTVKGAIDVLKAALMKNDFVAFMGMNDLMKIMNK